MYILLILLLFAISPFATIFLRSVGLWLFLPNVSAILAATLGLFLTLGYGALGVIIAGVVEDVITLRPLGVSSSLLLLLLLLSRYFLQRRFSLQNHRSRLVLALGLGVLVSLVGIAVDALTDWFAEQPLAPRFFTPLRLSDFFVSAMLIFIILSLRERARARRDLSMA